MIAIICKTWPKNENFSFLDGSRAFVFNIIDMNDFMTWGKIK
jgi:hypothetical protein